MSALSLCCPSAAEHSGDGDKTTTPANSNNDDHNDNYNGSHNNDTNNTTTTTRTKTTTTNSADPQVGNNKSGGDATGATKGKRPKGPTGGKHLAEGGKHLIEGGKQPKGKATATTTGTPASPLSPRDGRPPGQQSDGVNPWARCLAEEDSRRKGEGVGCGESESECTPVEAAEALFGRGRAVDGGTRAALEAEALILKALVPPT